jgi:3D (Asp-Asp-Asp) domain-containing protein
MAKSIRAWGFPRGAPSPGACLALFLVTQVAWATACAWLRPGPANELAVLATAYNSVPEQTSGDPFKAAWGDRLRPGLRAIAVSRDLVDLGLTRGTKVRIDGVDGEWVVLDKMAAHWKRRIDLYMGNDVAAARQWGVRRVTIRWWNGD